MLNDEPIFFENDSLIDKEMRKKIQAIEAPDVAGGAWKTKTGKRRVAAVKPKVLEEE
jgi:hypothetical protein